MTGRAEGREGSSEEVTHRAPVDLPALTLLMPRQTGALEGSRNLKTIDRLCRGVTIEDVTHRAPVDLPALTLLIHQ